MLCTVQFACTLQKCEADALNAESGRIYSDMLVRHYRLYRRQGVWLVSRSGERLEDALGGPTTLHAHSRDAAQQGFYKACKTARAARDVGLDVKYPYKRKRWRTTIWKAPKGIRLHAGILLLGRARGLAPVQVALPSHLALLPVAAFLEVRLVWDRAARHYGWHVVVEDGTRPAPSPPGDHTAAVDLGEIHPAALTDGQETVIITCRALRANAQYTAKRLSKLQAKQAHKKPGSRRWKRLQRRKSRFLAKQKRRARDLEHKISCTIVTWAKERQVSTLAIGDVRNVADGKRLNAKGQQKIGLWYTDDSVRTSPTRRRRWVSPSHWSKKPTPVRPVRAPCQMGRDAYSVTNPRGGSFAARLVVSTRHRDGVGCANLLSQYYSGEPGHVQPPPEKYRYPNAREA